MQTKKEGKKRLIISGFGSFCKYFTTVNFDTGFTTTVVFFSRSSGMPRLLNRVPRHSGTLTSPFYFSVRKMRLTILLYSFVKQSMKKNKEIAAEDVAVIIFPVE